MTVTITLAQAYQFAQEGVAERGAGFIYQKPQDSKQCQYFHGNQPGCFVGFIMAKLGITSKDLLIVPQLNAGSYLELYRAGVLQSDLATRYFLAELQTRQDSGTPWGAALESTVHLAQAQYPGEWNKMIKAADPKPQPEEEKEEEEKQPVSFLKKIFIPQPTAPTAEELVKEFVGV